MKDVLTFIKSGAEVITSISAAVIVIIAAIKSVRGIKDPLKRWFRGIIYHCGIWVKGECKDLSGKKVSLRKYLREQKETNNIITNALVHDVKTKEVLILNEDILKIFLRERGIITVEKRRM